MRLPLVPRSVEFGKAVSILFLDVYCCESFILCSMIEYLCYRNFWCCDLKKCNITLSSKNLNLDILRQNNPNMLAVKHWIFQRTICMSQ